ncbi:MAG: peptide-methionine (R)-S-oxide reductase MsrB [Rhodospirillaceae bacterium]|jgi:peptide-methionine (R)-S-oxide reductase|nr:peptide-methionine (R)-S-oxide reductase MsrB [Rhodospirillaceae bacterium]MBT4219186.1 peptide-methionine (R)-S-oxide reductase MsrB [Rhodospirillaceae bacterium]MBT4464316.1 peptide-methionine (R)-S-oxide reductase MsrB [Rhodospirillaceae bacterium]MBT5013100.1 peptide-methionine (R)-S-oxide reductase MsrB [Rhodospirillaceae bacterium]MBT6406227.1 peptide-methionine (R)-S-oxide reductase MsrB [Rhodospirillaceae bacterium]
MTDKITKSDEEWQSEMSPEQYEVTRKKGTERAFSGEYNGCKDRGIYRCSCCGAELFRSDSKFDSGSGWPSFWRASVKENVDEHMDATHGMVRTEVTCAKCDAHLGHVFTDGPDPTGLRYCVNSLSLKLETKD